MNVQNEAFMRLLATANEAKREADSAGKPYTPQLQSLIDWLSREPGNSLEDIAAEARTRG